MSPARQTIPPAPPSRSEPPTIPWTGLTVIVAVAGLLLLMAIPDLAPTPEELLAERAAIELRLEAESLRSAIADYHADHGCFPGRVPPVGASFAPEELDARWFERQMRMHSDGEGHVVPQSLLTHPHGPYLSRGLPRNPVNHLATLRMLAKGESMPTHADGSTGWIYDPATGAVRPNAVGRALDGRRYFDL